VSPTQTGPSGEPIVWGFGDGGDGRRIFAWDTADGSRQKTLLIRTDIVDNVDWESMTIGSCGSIGVDESCLYVVDSGDNTARTSGGRRSQRAGKPYRILKIKEPNLSDFEDQDHVPITYISALEYDYLSDSSPTDFADSEASFIDHVGWGEDGAIGDLYIVTKWSLGRQGIAASKAIELTRAFKIPADAWPTTTCAALGFYSPEAVGSYESTLEGEVVTGGQIMGREWRGGEMSYDGTLIALSDTETASIFLRCPGVSVADALAAPNAGTTACVNWLHPVQGQVETLSFYPDGSRTLNIPEGNRPRMGWSPLAYNSGSTNEACSASFSDFDTPPKLKIARARNLPVCDPTEAPTDPPTMAPTFVGQTFPPTSTPRPTQAPVLTTDAPSGQTTEKPTPSPSKSPITPVPTEGTDASTAVGEPTAAPAQGSSQTSPPTESIMDGDRSISASFARGTRATLVAGAFLAIIG